MEEKQNLIQPNSLDAERSVLGSMLLESKALEQMLEQLRAEDFYSGAHQRIFESMARVRLAGDAVDAVTLMDDLQRHGQLEAVGGAVYLTELMEFVPSAANVGYYARIVEERSVQRSLIQAGNEMIHDGMDEGKDIEDSLNQAEKRIYDISMRKVEDSLAPLSQIVPDAIAQIGDLLARHGQITGVPTGFRELDRVTNGLQKSDLIIIAARPAMGKSSFAMNIGQYAAVHGGRSVVYFSLEMSKEQLVMRMLCTEARVESQKIKEGTLSDEEMEAILSVTDKLQAGKLYIDDSGGATVASIRSKCRRLKAQSGLDMIIIDYMQLMSGTGSSARKSDNRQQEVADMTRAMKLLARELDVPILLLSQLNRGPEQRTDHKPIIADLRESGSIEQDADMVLLLYRPQVYDETLDNTSQVIIAKHRHGPTGTVELAWLGQFTKFEDIARE